jgi:hypothetical protein
MIDQLKRVRFVTERYPHLQGLRLLPIAIPFLGSAAWRGGYLRWLPGAAEHGATYWFFGTFVAALAAALVLGLYYRRRFGSVQLRRSLGSSLLFFAFVTALFVSLSMQAQSEWPISMPLIVTGLALAYVGVVGGRVRPAYIVVGAASVLFAVLGAFGVPFHTRDVLLDGLIGSGLIAIGISDHVLLIDILEPRPHAGTV